MHSTRRQARHAPSTNNLKTTITATAMALACLAASAVAPAADGARQKNANATFDPSGCVRPQWPQGSLEAKLAGTVTLALLVGEDGKIQQSKVTKSSGHEELDEAARASIAKCAFKPSHIDGQPREAWLLMQYVWTPD